MIDAETTSDPILADSPGGVTGACCGPARSTGDETSVMAESTKPNTGRQANGPTEHMVRVEGGRFTIGTEDPDGFPADGEGPVREVELSPYRIDRYAVSNRRFAEFIDATGHVTHAERYGWSFVFGGLLPDEFPATRGAAQAPWWRQVHGAWWRAPEGPDTSIEGRLEHPVVHASFGDAVAFCAWAGVRLPTEAEWEHAARGGLDRKRFPWGDELKPNGEHRMNVWQGIFPSQNTLEDGHLGTCRVDEFPANGFGLHNTSGNIWEWCADWFHATFHRTSPQPTDPPGPQRGESRVMRGGSYLCHDSYCNRYRVGARSSSTPESSTGNIGFRCAADPEELRGDEQAAARI